MNAFTVRDDSSVIMNFKHSYDLSISLQDENDRLILEQINRKLKLAESVQYTAYFREE